MRYILLVQEGWYPPPLFSVYTSQHTLTHFIYDHFSSVRGIPHTIYGLQTFIHIIRWQWFVLFIPFVDLDTSPSLCLLLHITAFATYLTRAVSQWLCISLITSTWMIILLCLRLSMICLKACKLRTLKRRTFTWNTREYHSFGGTWSIPLRVNAVWRRYAGTCKQHNSRNNCKRFPQSGWWRRCHTIVRRIFGWWLHWKSYRRLPTTWFAPRLDGWRFHEGMIVWNNTPSNLNILLHFAVPH